MTETLNLKNAIILILLLGVVSCSTKSIPFGLRSTIKNIDKDLNDTVKYDFKIAPENIATSKHHFGLGLDIRNGKNLWKGGLLKTYFKLNGIKHPDDMSGIILTTYHRKLNSRPIEFKNQKNYYKEYWQIAKIGRDTLEKWYDFKNKMDTTNKADIEYLSHFNIGEKVLGSINAWKKWDNGNMSGTEVKFIAEIIDQKERIIKSKIIKLGRIDEGFELEFKVGDTIQNNPYEIYLIPKNE